MRRLIDLTWFLITWGTFVVVACALLAGLYFYNRVDEEIRALVEARLAEVYPDMSVVVHSARLVERRGFEVRGVSISLLPGDGARQEVLYAERISIACRPTLEDLVARRLQVESVTVRGLRVRATRGVEGSWDVQRLIRPPKLKLYPPPSLSIEGAVVEILDPQAVPPALYTLRDVNMALTPDLESDSLVSAASAASSGVPVVPADYSPRYQMVASLTGDHMQRTTISAVVLPKERRFALRGHLPRLLVSPELRQALPAELAMPLARLGSLRCGATADFELSYNARPGEGWVYRVDGQLVDGHVDDARLTYPVTDMQASVHWDADGIELTRFAARYGSAAIQLSSQPVTGGNSELSVIEGSVKDLHVDERLASWLPERYQRAWNDFQPRGLIDARFRLTYGPQVWLPELHVVCRDAAVVWRGFPLPCRNVTGTVDLTSEVATFDLLAYAQDQPLVVRGEVQHPGNQWTGVIELKTREPQPITSALVAALPPGGRAIVRGLAPQGDVAGQARLTRTDAHQPVDRQVSLQLIDAEVRHRAFPYPLRNVSGQVTLANNIWRFQQLQGNNDSARVQCDGDWHPTPAGGQLRLDFRCQEVALDDELRQSLQPAAQRIWSQLRPRGTLDALDAQLTYTPRDGVDLRLRMRQHPRGVAESASDIAVFPVPFPYRVEEITGEVSYHAGRCEFTSLRGRHGETRMATAGHTQVQDDGTWQLVFNDLAVDHMLVDRDMMTALPPGLRRVAEQVKVTGPLHLRGALALHGELARDALLQTDWDMALHADHVHVDVGLPLRDLAGSLQLRGQQRPDKFFSRGQLQVDSVMIHDLQFTNVRGPVWFNDTELRLGSWAQPVDSDEPRQRLTARVFEGDLASDVQVLLDESGRFVVHADLREGKLAAAVRQVAPQVTPLHGVARANLKLAGTRSGTHSLQGTGEMSLREANLYELPFILTLLKTLRSGSVDRAAFDSSNMLFRIQGEHVYFDRIDLIGDSVTLKGVGEMNTDRRVNLDFYTILGRENAYVPAIRSLFGMTNGRFLQIHVNGPLDNPTMVREVLPGLNETLETLFPESVQPAEVASGTNSSLRGTGNGRQDGLR